MAKTYSLSTVTVNINNPSYDNVYGQVVIGGQQSSTVTTTGGITIGGAAKLVDTISYNYDNNMFTMDSSPDGGYVANYNGSKAGSVSISLKQTSSHIKDLTNFINWCYSNPEQVENTTMKISDELGNISMSASGVFPQKLPENSVSSRAGTRQFSFVAGQIDSEER